MKAQTGQPRPHGEATRAPEPAAQGEQAAGGVTTEVPCPPWNKAAGAGCGMSSDTEHDDAAYVITQQGELQGQMKVHPLWRTQGEEEPHMGVRVTSLGTTIC